MPEPKKKAPARKPRAKVPENETKAEKLIRLAVPRVNRALKILEQIAKLAAYSPTEEQSGAVINSLSGKLAEVKTRLAGAKPTSAGFTLPPAA